MGENLGVFQHKANLYKCLSELYNKPSDRLLSFFEPLKSSLVALYPDLVTLSEKLEEEFNNLYTLDKELTNLTVEHAKLFIGPFDVLAPPYSSIYLESGRQLQGESTTYAEKIYHEAGIAISEGFKDVPDHIKVELEFVYYLYYQYVETNEVSHLHILTKFIHTHLSKWVMPFKEQLLGRANLDFYRTLGELTANVVMAEREELKAKPTIN
ncbi:molecular chaperone TorD family protein [Bacillus sp. B15-48]|uniref:TorD/DmsD family molecular chaperone n=1 Tax=Bacillus sp. B15-48 TaxID=1548601 RepID=UPI00193F0BF4|nr:molecular chaperone TorD family protein [Bacillus sp. B15-48]MBM4761066.1 dehydrogenase [Bacillus sp. B15-48]